MGESWPILCITSKEKKETCLKESCFTCPETICIANLYAKENIFKITHMKKLQQKK